MGDPFPFGGGEARYRVVTPSPFNPPPQVVEPVARPSRWGLLVNLLVRPAWAWRVELAGLVGVAVAGKMMAHLVGPVVAGLVLVVLVAVGVVVPAVRESVGWSLRRSRLRRGFARACRHAELATPNDRVPRIVEAARTLSGERLRVRLPAGSSAVALQDAAERLAVVLDVREVRVTRDADHAAYATVAVVRRDPLATGPIAWPWAEAVRCSLWHPIPVGVDEDGQWVTVALPERNVLVGGEPGAGKSAGLSLLVAVAALDPSVRLVLLDGKLVELACWAGCADRTVGPDIQAAIAVLGELRAELDARYAALLANRRRKLAPELGKLGMGLVVVVVDELMFYVAHPDKRHAAEFTSLLRDLVARGRAAGIIVVAATQKPAAEVIPTSLRDLFGFRWAFRCLTPEASDTILGRGWASLGYSAQQIDAASRGVGYLLHEGEVPVRLRACWLDDQALLALAWRAELLRARATLDAQRAGGGGLEGSGSGGVVEGGGRLA